MRSLFEEAQEEFLAEVGVSKTQSPSTLNAYANDLGQFRAFLAGKYGSGPSNIPHKISADGVRGFIQDLSRKGYKPSSIARKTSCIRSFLRFLERRGVLLPRLPSRDPEKRKQEPPKVLSEDEVESLMQAVDARTPLGKRDRAMLVSLRVRAQDK